MPRALSGFGARIAAVTPGLGQTSSSRKRSITRVPKPPAVGPGEDGGGLADRRGRERRGGPFRVLATNRVFETLMREHYLRGLRDGLVQSS